MNIDLIVKLSGRTKSWAMSLQLLTEKDAIEAVKEDGYALQYVKYQTETICIEAVKENGDALQYVKDLDKNDSEDAI